MRPVPEPQYYRILKDNEPPLRGDAIVERVARGKLYRYRTRRVSADTPGAVKVIQPKRMTVARFASETIERAGGPQLLEAAARAVIEADEAVDRSRAISGRGRADDDLVYAADLAHEDLGDKAMVSGETADVTREIARQVLELTTGIVRDPASDSP